jgi:hypothetical protein
MNKTAVEWLEQSLILSENAPAYDQWAFDKAKVMERNERLKHQLFIGKVTEIIGFDKAVELLKECNELFKSEQQ